MVQRYTKAMMDFWNCNLCTLHLEKVCEKKNFFPFTSSLWMSMCEVFIFATFHWCSEILPLLFSLSLSLSLSFSMLCRKCQGRDEIRAWKHSPSLFTSTRVERWNSTFVSTYKSSLILSFMQGLQLKWPVLVWSLPFSFFLSFFLSLSLSLFPRSKWTVRGELVSLWLGVYVDLV